MDERGKAHAKTFFRAQKQNNRKNAISAEKNILIGEKKILKFI